MAKYRVTSINKEGDFEEFEIEAANLTEAREIALEESDIMVERIYDEEE